MLRPCKSRNSSSGIVLTNSVIKIIEVFVELSIGILLAVEDAIHAGVTAYTVNAERIRMAHIKHPPHADQLVLYRDLLYQNKQSRPKSKAEPWLQYL